MGAAALTAFLAALGARPRRGHVRHAAGGGMAQGFLFALGGSADRAHACVYPMIPITVSIFGGKRRAALGALLLATLRRRHRGHVRRARHRVRAGRQGVRHVPGNPWVIVPLALFFVAMAASMFGAFELGLPRGCRRLAHRVGGRTPQGAFLMGLVGGLIAAPCTGPPLAGCSRTSATTRECVRGSSLLATYASGVGVPFWLAGVLDVAAQVGRRGWRPSRACSASRCSSRRSTTSRTWCPRWPRFTGPSAFLAVGRRWSWPASRSAASTCFHDALEGARARRRASGWRRLGLFAITNYVLTPKVEWPCSTAAAEAAASVARAARCSWTSSRTGVSPARRWTSRCSRSARSRRCREFTFLRVDLSREDDDP